MNIKVSVIIPAYNVEKYIERTIKSVMNQSLKEIEIIIVNDGSTDKTLEIVKKLSLKDNRIKIINKKNGGLSSARNAGLEVVKGLYIQHLDGDDWIERNALEKLYKISIENNLDLLVSDFYIDDDNGNKKLIKTVTNKSIMTNKDYLKYYLLSKEYPYIWNKFVKAEIYKEIRHPVEISLGEDMVASVKVIYNSKKIMKQSEPFVHYINNVESITRSKSKCEKQIEKFMAIDMIEKYLLSKDKSYEMKNMINEYRLFNINYFLYQEANFKSKKYNEAYSYFEYYLKNSNPEILKNILSKKQLVILKFIKNNLSKLNFRVLNFFIVNIFLKIKNN